MVENEHRDHKLIAPISVTDSGVMAPAHATVVSIRARFVMPSTDCRTTCAWAGWSNIPIANTAISKGSRFNLISIGRPRNSESASDESVRCARSLSGIRSLQPRINNLQTRDGS